MVDDEQIVELRDKLIVAQQALVSEYEYDLATSGDPYGWDFPYQDQHDKYQEAIDALNNLLKMNESPF